MDTKLSLIVALALVTQFTPIRSEATTREESKLLNTSPDAANSPQLYTFGGLNDDKVLKSASHLNSTTGKWMAGFIPDPDYLFCGAVADKKIFLFGGYENNNDDSKSDMSMYYDCLDDIYTLIPLLPESRAACGAAALNGSIYVAGGTVGSVRGPSSSLIRYDIQNTQWLTLSPMNSKRSLHQLIELNGLLYAIGGSTADVGKTVEVYNTTSDRWSFVASTLNEHYNFGAVAHEGKIYVLSQHGFEVYSPGTDQWTKLDPPIEHFYYASQLVTMNGELWTTGGRSIVNGKAIDTKQVFTYDPSTDRWTKQPDMDVPRSHHTAFVVNH